MTGTRRDRLQNQSPGCSFPALSMNDFPMPEDPPVTMTAEKLWSTSRSEGTTAGRENFQSRQVVCPGSVTQT
jgi:hypothetical protein